MNILVFEVEGFFHDRELFLDAGDALEIESIFGEVVNFAFLNFREGEVTHAQSLESKVVNQNYVWNAVGDFRISVCDVGQVRNVVVEKELLVKFLAPELNPDTLVVKELLKFPLFPVFAVHLLENIIFKYAQASLFELVDLLVHHYLILVDTPVFVPDMLSFLQRPEV